MDRLIYRIRQALALGITIECLYHDLRRDFPGDEIFLATVAAKMLDEYSTMNTGAMNGG